MLAVVVFHVLILSELHADFNDEVSEHSSKKLEGVMPVKGNDVETKVESRGANDCCVSVHSSYSTRITLGLSNVPSINF